MNGIVGKGLYGTVYGVCNTFVESTNHVASEWIGYHIDELKIAALRMGVCKEKSDDIVADVLFSILQDEDEGNGYDPTKSTRSECISVEGFVYGRLKGYSKNKDYWKPSGNQDEIPASCSTDDVDKMTPVQRAYNVLAVYDPLEEVERKCDVESALDLVMQYKSSFTFSLEWFLKNIELVIQKKMDTSLFDGIKQMMDKDDEFKDAFLDVAIYAMNNQADMGLMLSAYA